MRRLIAAAMVICGGALGLASGAAAAATPAWTIEAVPYPSAFAPGAAYDATEAGPAYLVQAYNVGGGQTSGEFTLTDTLPSGLLPAAGFPPTGHYGPKGGETFVRQMSCSILGRTITCTGGGTEGPVGPGEPVSVVVPVEVQGNAAAKAAAAGGFLTDQASIGGGGAVATATAEQPTSIGSASSPFGFLPKPAGFYGLASEADGSPAGQAGSHPYQMTVAGMNLTTNPNDLEPLLASGGGLREAVVALPRGTVVDPVATPHCREAQLESGEHGCPDTTQVGTVELTLSPGAGFGEGPSVHPVYNMVAPPGYPAELGFEVLEGSYVHLLGSVSSDGTFTLTASARDVLARAAIGGVRTTLWSDPAAESHDGQRGACLFDYGMSDCQVPVGERTGKAFLTLPAACSGPLTTTVRASSWLGELAAGSYGSTDLAGAPLGISGCEGLSFEPSITARPRTGDQGGVRSDSPAGLEFDLRQVQHQGLAERGNAPLKDTTVTLPEGMALNPSAANGRVACDAGQVGYDAEKSRPEGDVRFLEEPAHCPDASKIGTATATTPLLDHELPGAIYLAKPFDNPFDSLLAIYLVVEDEASGIIAKLAGKVEPDPATGQLRTTFEESPELPLEDVHLSFFEGPRAALTTPLTCGAKTTTGQLTPWSTSTPTAVSDSFEVTSTPGGGPCPATEADAPKDISFSAGTTNPLAGAYSPFVLKLERGDGTQRITTVDTTLPAGLTGRLAGIPYCSDSAIGQAEARSHPEEGKLEQQAPSCPTASEVGTVTVGAGSGSNPVYVTGHAYLAGPYKGAPLSLAIITPAVTGPFDLGVVVVRVALEVNLETAQITAESDPLPTILDGIPLDVRSIAISLDRSGFTLNPTDCDASEISAQVGTLAGQSAAVTERFGVEGCGRLAFKPRLKVSLKGATRRAGHPALRAVVSYPKQGAYANIARAQVGLPHALFLDQGNLNKVCKQADLKAATCPKSSIYGHAKAWTPLLEKPLEGPVYLGVGFGYKLPALVADLNGQIRILLHGRVDTTRKKGLRNTFEVVPDAPVSRFVLRMKGGKKYSLLENSEDLCAKTRRASARFVAQNGRVAQLHPKIAVQCRKKKAKKSRRNHRGARHHGTYHRRGGGKR